MALLIGANSVVAIHYTLKNDAGEILDSSEGSSPLVYLHGAQNIIVGLENALQGKSVGEKFSTAIPPELGYGVSRPQLVQVIKKEMFEDADTIEPGMSFAAQGADGRQQAVRVTAVSADEVTVDANHPMAGMTLHFAVEVVDIRDATRQELAHGHVHQHGHDH